MKTYEQNKQEDDDIKTVDSDCESEYLKQKSSFGYIYSEELKDTQDFIRKFSFEKISESKK